MVLAPDAAGAARPARINVDLGDGANGDAGHGYSAAQDARMRAALVVPRSGNASGGGQPGWILKCKGWETDPNAYIYFIAQAPVWEAICDVIGKPEWKTDPDYAKPPARLPRLRHIWDTIEAWTMTKTKFEAMDILNKYDIPCGPILSLKEIAEDQSLRKTGTVVEVGDGIARISGLPDCAVNELLEFEDGTKGLALNLEEEAIGAVVLGGLAWVVWELVR